MSRPKLSYFVRQYGFSKEKLARFRSRGNILFGVLVPGPPLPFAINGMGWEGDKFVLTVKVFGYTSYEGDGDAKGTGSGSS